MKITISISDVQAADETAAFTKYEATEGFMEEVLEYLMIGSRTEQQISQILTRFRWNKHYSDRLRPKQEEKEVNILDNNVDKRADK